MGVICIQSYIQPLSINSAQDSCINTLPYARLDRYVGHSGVHGRWIHTPAVPHIILCRTYLVAFKRIPRNLCVRGSIEARLPAAVPVGCQREQFRCKPLSPPIGRDQIRIDLGHHVDTLEEQIWLRLTLIRSAFMSVKSIAICNVMSASENSFSITLIEYPLVGGFIKIAFGIFNREVKYYCTALERWKNSFFFFWCNIVCTICCISRKMNNQKLIILNNNKI